MIQIITPLFLIITILLVFVALIKVLEHDDDIITKSYKNLVLSIITFVYLSSILLLIQNKIINGILIGLSGIIWIYNYYLIKKKL